MAYSRTRRISRLSLGIALAGLLLACGKDATGPESAAVITEADVTGTWRTSVPAAGFTVKVIMEVTADHNMNFAQKYAGVVPGKPDSAVDKSYESGTWSLNAGILTSQKVACRYASPPNFQLKDSTCIAPVSNDYSLAIKGNTMTVVLGTATFVFTRD
ncbi:MAG: hypothetical protein JWO30_4248 [Fibrobacteres bacterium]|nr:hypothetical protein [Fibrobacterota bacterium]